MFIFYFQRFKSPVEKKKKAFFSPGLQGPRGSVDLCGPLEGLSFEVFLSAGKVTAGEQRGAKDGRARTANNCRTESKPHLPLRTGGPQALLEASSVGPWVSFPAGGTGCLVAGGPSPLTP